MATMDKMIQKLALPLLALAGGLLIVVYISSIRGTNNENNGYIRVINCIISENAVTRTQSDIESCYQKVENDLGIKLQRYDSSNPH